MSEQEKIFGFTRIAERTTKPRTTGLTMVEADVMLSVAGMHWVEDLVEWGGQWIDYFKVGRTMMFQPWELVVKKLAYVKQHGTEPYVGGNTTEVVVAQGCLEPYLDELQELGIGVMEVSSTVLSLPLKQKVKLIEKVRGRGFTVFAEVGKKLIGAGGPRGRMPTSEVIREMKACLGAGAFKVVYEHTEIEQLPTEEDGLSRLLEVAGEVGADNIMFEVPVAQWKEAAPYAAFYVLNFGPNVNIADVDPIHVVMLEALRSGLSTRTFAKVVV